MKQPKKTESLECQNSSNNLNIYSRQLPKLTAYTLWISSVVYSWYLEVVFKNDSICRLKGQHNFGNQKSFAIVMQAISLPWFLFCFLCNNRFGKIGDYQLIFYPFVCTNTIISTNFCILWSWIIDLGYNCANSNAIDMNMLNALANETKWSSLRNL